MNSQQLHKRTVNLDILRIIALIFIPCLHYFLYTGFYSKELSSNFMYVAYFARNLFLLGLPMFMLLTGFLQGNKKFTISKDYFIRITKFLIPYVIITLVYLLIDAFYFKNQYSVQKTIETFTTFINYSWYVEMYIHHGVFDVGFLRQIPGMTVLCPANFEELRHMLRWAVNDCTGPVAVRYPRGNACFGAESTFNGDPSGIYTDSSEKDAMATLITYGSIATQAKAAVEKLAARDLRVRMLTLNSVTHFSESTLADLVCGKHVFVVEEICSGSGISETITMCLQKQNISCKVHALDLGLDFVPHGHTSGLYKQTGLDCDSITDYISEVLLHEN